MVTAAARRPHALVTACAALLLTACLSEADDPADPESPDADSPDAIEPDMSGDVGEEGGVISPNDGFIVGVNLPWLHYGHDFGENGWGHDGVSTPDSRARLESDFELLAGAGIRAARVFVFADGRASPEIDGRGATIGFDARFFDDFDALLQIAGDAGVDLVPVLFDYLWFAEAVDENGVQLGGRAIAITEPANRELLVERAIAPLFEAYGSHASILAWDVINEPEWAMRIPGGRLVTESVDAEIMYTFVADVLAAARAADTQPITLGSADAEWMREHWAEADLDWLQFHYYRREPFSLDSAGLGVVQPVLVGELPTASTALGVTETLDAIADGGFAGALFWSLNGDDEASDLAGRLEAIRAWTEARQ